MCSARPLVSTKSPQLQLQKIEEGKEEGREGGREGVREGGREEGREGGRERKRREKREKGFYPIDKNKLLFGSKLCLRSRQCFEYISHQKFVTKLTSKKCYTLHI